MCCGGPVRNDTARHWPILEIQVDSAIPLDIRTRAFLDGDHEANARAFSNAFPDFPVTANNSRRVDASRKNRTSIVAECGTLA